ncbi:MULTISPECIES: LysR family transcriptional regulator [unclassified Pseudoalteromonas]|uniref:LysR family transcriptional regulator n=1 Tax=unclassified Pseudoalteromonas TaxID=194690 RepID=UPI0030152AAB
MAEKLNKLRAMEMFVSVANLGSFTQAAQHFNTSKSVISKEISKLELALGGRLLHRTTRNLQLTYTGEEYLQRAKNILNSLDEAEHCVLESGQRAKGKLKVNVPMVLGLTDLALMFADFMQAYPEIELEVHLGDEDIDLVKQGFDLGFRASSQPFDSNYIGKQIAQFDYHICVSQSYLDNNPKIKIPQDLSYHNCFEYSYAKRKNVWPLDNGVRIKGTLKANNVLFMLQAIKLGHGIGMLPEFACREAIDNQEVVSILAHSKKPKLTLYALYPARHHVPNAVMQCIEFLRQWFASK